MCSNSEDATEYTQILAKSDVISEANKVYGTGCWCLVQDGAPCHRSKQSLDWLDKHRILVMPGWPPNSPDLNPIEMVWGIMKRSLRWDVREKWSREEMFTELEQVWTAVHQDSLDRLSESFIARCPDGPRCGRGKHHRLSIVAPCSRPGCKPDATIVDR